MIDLHLHTTASDGLLVPAALVERAAAAGLTIIAVTDHDTVGGLAEAVDAGRTRGVRVVAGIEMTAVEDEHDVHVLGYFIDPDNAILAGFLSEQRDDRIRRVREIGARLRSLGVPIDVDALSRRRTTAAAASAGRRLPTRSSRPGTAVDRTDAFARLLGRGRPAFVPRRGVSAAAVDRHDPCGRRHRVAGAPRNRADDALIEALAGSGLDAIEVWHSDHSPGAAASTTARWPIGSVSQSPAARTFTATVSITPAGSARSCLPGLSSRRLEAASESRR